MSQAFCKGAVAGLSAWTNSVNSTRAAKPRSGARRAAARAVAAPPPPAPAANDSSSQEQFKVVDGGLPRTAKVGILGGGQLGRMLAIAGAPMGVRLNVLDESDPAPASIASTQTFGSFRDRDAVMEFAKDCDVVTVEIEHIDTVGRCKA